MAKDIHILAGLLELNNWVLGYVQFFPGFLLYFLYRHLGLLASLTEFLCSSATAYQLHYISRIDSILS